MHGRISFQGRDLDDFVILRSDGTAIYNMAVVSDDIAMAITHVIRGDDHISNTPKQIALYRAFGARDPGLRARPDDPRHGRQEALEAARRHRGRRLPGPRASCPPRCGTSSPSSAGRRARDREIMPEDEMIALFTLEGIQKKAAVFDATKLEWMNGQYLSATPADDLLAAVRRRAGADRRERRRARPASDHRRDQGALAHHPPVADRVAVRLDPVAREPGREGAGPDRKMGPAFSANLLRAAEALEPASGRVPGPPTAFSLAQESGRGRRPQAGGRHAADPGGPHGIHRVGAGERAARSGGSGAEPRRMREVARTAGDQPPA